MKKNEEIEEEIEVESEGEIKEIKENKKEKTEEKIIEEIEKIFVEWEEEIKKSKKQLIEFMPDIDNIYSKIIKPIVEDFSLKINFKNKIEILKKEYSHIEFFFKNAKRFDILHKSFENFINKKKENQKVSNINNIKFKGVEVKYKDFYEQIIFFVKQKISAILQAKEKCEKIMKKFKEEYYACDEFKNNLEYIGIKFEQENNVNDKENGDEIIKKEIDKVFEELKKRRKKEKIDKIKNYVKKVGNKVSKIGKKLFSKKGKVKNENSDE
uniref:Uncharacterized protein n=1 Tax=Meloidogyne hapla TaxID=6305 RepID=A0A1I8B386_MELHA